MRRLSLSVAAIAFLLVVGVAAAQTVTGPGVDAAVGTAGTTVTRSHKVTVDIPTVLAIQLRNAAGATNADILFNISSSAYATALFNNGAISPSVNNLRDVRVFTNDGSGADFQIGVSQFSTTTTKTPTPDISANLLFNGSPGSAWNVHVNPYNIQQLLTGSMITYQPSGTEGTGTYVLVVTYTATAQ